MVKEIGPPFCVETRTARGYSATKLGEAPSNGVETWLASAHPISLLRESVGIKPGLRVSSLLEEQAWPAAIDLTYEVLAMKKFLVLAMLLSLSFASCQKSDADKKAKADKDKIQADADAAKANADADAKKADADEKVNK